MRFSIIGLCVVFLVATSAWARQEPPATQPTENLQVCLAPALDGSPIYPSDTFPPVTELYAVFRGAKGHTLKHSWVAVDVGEVAPPNTEIVNGTLDISNVTQGNMHLTTTQSPLPLGKYRLDVYVDGNLWKSAPFRIVMPLTAPKLASPNDLVPLANKGTTWTYDFVQEAINGATLDIPAGVKADPDGKLRFQITETAAGDDGVGLRVNNSRYGNVYYNEWYKIDDHGISSIQRKSGNDVIPLKPLQPYWPWPLEAKSWTYKPDDGSANIDYRIWGPLPVEGPQGVVPGYVLMIQQDATPIGMFAERHLVPGIGMVKEVSFMTLNKERVQRTILTLKQMK
jgi:hypothetical protein